jgi:heat-inducible transcriptional repressor
MLNPRRRRVLSALIEEYVNSAHPVGSKSLVERYELGCSPATVRNELAILEETGYVFQPHTSAGRVPTDSGYRTFVDDLLASNAESPEAEGDSRTEVLARASELDELMRETSSVLTRLTSYMAVVLAPTVARTAIRRIDLLPMAPRRALVVVITESGYVVNRHVDLPVDTAPDRVAEIERSMNASLVGKRAADIRSLMETPAGPEGGGGLVSAFLDEVLDCLDEADTDRLYHGGVPALLGHPEFADAEHVLPVMNALEDGLAMLETLSDLLEGHGVVVRIGHENRRVELGNVSIVATNYGVSSGEGVVGVIGPTRMDYPKAIAAVQRVAEGLSEALS